MLKLEQEYEHIKQEIKIRSLKSNPNVWFDIIIIVKWNYL
jgi:hypothetical protein